jgi:hypothetical protein
MHILESSKFLFIKLNTHSLLFYFRFLQSGIRCGYSLLRHSFSLLFREQMSSYLCCLLVNLIGNLDVSAGCVDCQCMVAWRGWK